MQLTDKIEGVVISRAVEMRISGDETVRGTWSFDFSGCTLESVLQQAVSSKIIAEMNRLRKNVQAREPEALESVRQHTFRVAEVAARNRVVEKSLSPAEMLDKIRGMNDEERQRYIDMLSVLAAKPGSVPSTSGKK